MRAAFVFCFRWMVAVTADYSIFKPEIIGNQVDALTLSVEF